MEIIGFGASAQVYEVDDQTVLKTSWLLSDLGIVPLTAIDGTMPQIPSFSPTCYKTNGLYYDCFDDVHTLTL